jgi:hypothetical protein
MCSDWTKLYSYGLLKTSLVESELPFGVTENVTMSLSKLYDATTIGTKPKINAMGIWSSGV